MVGVHDGGCLGSAGEDPTPGDALRALGELHGLHLACFTEKAHSVRTFLGVLHFFVIKFMPSQPADLLQLLKRVGRCKD
jgi:hypothetical protein